jgi:formylmethanofuran dehydrogenase subunit E
MNTDGRYDYASRGFYNGQVIKVGTAKQTSFQDVTRFHGHVCPGIVIGYRAAKIATRELSPDESVDEESVSRTISHKRAIVTDRLARSIKTT